MLVDRIGHVDLRCGATVFAAYRTWLDMAFREAQAPLVASVSSPPVPPPPPLPAPPVVPDPWLVFWSRVDARYWYYDPEFEKSTFLQPPVVPDGWRVYFAPAEQRFYFGDLLSGSTTWELPNSDPESWWARPGSSVQSLDAVRTLDASGENWA